MGRETPAHGLTEILLPAIQSAPNGWFVSKNQFKEMHILLENCEMFR